MKSNIKIIIFVIFLLLFLSAVVLKVTKKEEAGEITKIVAYTEDFKGLGYSGQRKIVQDSFGNYYVTFRKKYEGKYQIYVGRIFKEKRDWKTSGFEKPAVIINSGADQRVPSIAVKDKKIYVVWYGSDSQDKDQRNNRQIKFIKSDDNGKSWTKAKSISIVDGYDRKEDYWQEHPFLLVGNDNNLYLTWEGKDIKNKNQQIKFSRSTDDGENWSQWKNVYETTNNTQSRPNIVQSTDGKLHMFFYSSAGNDNDSQQIKYLWSDDQGGSWNGWSAISNNSLDARHASVTINQNIIHVAWRQIKDGKAQIVYRAFENGSWKDEIALSDSSKNAFFPSITVDDKKEAKIVWMETGQDSSLPREDPQDGQIAVATVRDNKIADFKTISNGDKNLYPNVPENYTGNFLPLVYESFEAEDKYNVIFKLLK